MDEGSTTMLAGAKKLGFVLALSALASLPLGMFSAVHAQVTFDLCTAAGSVTMPDGVRVPIWGFGRDTGARCNPMLPGPQLDVPAGSTVTVNLTNHLPKRVSIIFPGQDVLPDTVGAAPNGGTVSYSFTAANPGTYLYEAGNNPGIQLPMGLYGALIVRPDTPGQAYDDPATAYDSEAVLVLGELDAALNEAVKSDTFGTAGAPSLLDYAPEYWLINGASYPDTRRIRAVAGSRLLIRYLNPGSIHHTITLLGAHQRVIARDAYPLRHPFEVVAETLPSGQTVDVIVDVPADALGSSWPLYSRQLYLSTGNLPRRKLLHPVGGMLTFINVRRTALAAR